MTEDIFFAGIADLNGRLRKREFSTVELVKAFAERLEKLGPRYNALALPLASHFAARWPGVGAGGIQEARITGDCAQGWFGECACQDTSSVGKIVPGRARILTLPWHFDKIPLALRQEQW